MVPTGTAIRSRNLNTVLPSENTHKKMVNVYGLLERLVSYPDAEKAVKSILDEHRIIDVKNLLDLIPKNEIRDYLSENP